MGELFFLAHHHPGLNNFLQNYKKGCCPLRYGVYPSIIFYIETSLCLLSQYKSQKTNLTYTHWQPLCFIMPIMSQEIQMSWTAHLKKFRWATPVQSSLTILCKAFQTSFLLEWHSLILQNFYLALVHDTDINMYKIYLPNFKQFD